MVTKTIHVRSFVEENLSRGLLNTLSLNVVLNIDYVMICLVDRGHPFNSMTGDGEFVSRRPRVLFSRVCIRVLTTWDRQ